MRAKLSLVLFYNLNIFLKVYNENTISGVVIYMSLKNKVTNLKNNYVEFHSMYVFNRFLRHKEKKSNPYTLFTYSPLV